MMAAQSGRIAALAALLKAGADVRQVDREGNTALHAATQYGQSAAAALLLAAGASLSATNQYGATPFFYAAAETPTTTGHPALVKRLLADYGADVNQPDCYGQSPLAAASDPEVVAALLAAGAGVVLSANPVIALVWLSKWPGALENARTASTVSADLNHADHWGLTPLSLAILDNKQGKAVQLIAAGANLETRLPDGTTILQAAVSRGQEAVVRQLLARGSAAGGPSELGRALVRAGATDSECATDSEAATAGGAAGQAPQHEDAVRRKCAACGAAGRGLRKCGRCRAVVYCDAVCQKAHWQAHKRSCRPQAAEF